MPCRQGCGACCIAPSITTAIPGMPDGKPAGVRCVQLTLDNHCRLFGLDERPALCAQFHAEPASCGNNQSQAMELLAVLEIATVPQ